MTETITLRPACAGADIRDPATGERLPAGGAVKPRDPYWVGLLSRGDVAEVAPPAASAQQQPADPAAETAPPAPPVRRGRPA